MSDNQNTDINGCYDKNEEQQSTKSQNSSSGSFLIPRRGSLKGMNIQGRMQSSSFFGQKKQKVQIKQLKLLRECSKEEIPGILLEKIDQCNIMFDFCETNADIREKEIKRSILSELVSFIPENTRYLTKTVYHELISMIGKNILRILPPTVSHVLEVDDENTIYEASWPHLQSVYDLFLTMLELSEFNTKFASAVLDLRFISQLLELFNSEDVRERDSLKTILHRIYGKFLHYRTSIRHMVNNIFLRFTHENDPFSGISELLEIYGSIINGFALPLKNEHKKFLVNVLLPMHKVPTLNVFHSQLAYCVLQFIDKDPTLSLQITKALVKYWPRVSSHKEIIFLNELEEIIELSEVESFDAIKLIVFKQVAKCCISSHFQVSERALCFWQNDYVLKLFSDYNEHIIPVVFKYLYETSISHWNTTINAIAISVLNIVVEINPKICSEVASDYQRSLTEAKENSKYTKFIEKFTTIKFD